MTIPTFHINAFLYLPKLRMYGGILLCVCLFTACYPFRKLQKEEISPVVTVLSPEEQRKYEYFFLEAVRLKAKGDHDAAFDLLGYCLSMDPHASSALYEIAQLYFLLQQDSLGQMSLEKAVTYAPDNYWYSQALVNVYHQKDKRAEAIALLESMTQRFPTHYELLFGLTDLYNQFNNYDLAINTLNRLEEKIGKDEELSMEKFRIYLQIHDDKRAFKEIESLTEEYPSDMRYLTILGDVYQQNGKKEEAFNTYQKVLSIEPDNYSALYSLVNFYEQTGQKEQHKTLVDSLLLNSKVPEDLKADMIRQFVIKTTDKQDTTKLIALFDYIIKQNIDDVQIPTLYAQYLLSVGMEDRAATVLKTILQLDPNDTKTRTALLGYAIRKEDREEIIELCESGIEVSPQITEYYYYLGVAHVQKGQLDEALEIYKKALATINKKARPELTSDLYAMMGDLYFQKQQTANAYLSYDSALVCNPSNIGALNNYAYYLSVEHGNLDKAEEMSYETIKKEPQNFTYLDTYAWILFEKKNYTEARTYIDDAMKNGGEENDVIVEHCGDIYYMNDDKESALKYWLKAQELGGGESKTLEEKIKQKKYIAE
ncbi:Beta-barrel assembly-enhancing protease [termite gut metagenome]|uniref:Beta-barrel assembly-enhancing protease n=1 Tax=termite gut metagenome TaxID=433724 RepID=A0A5J4QTP7_9ZZZZ